MDFGDVVAWSLTACAFIIGLWAAFRILVWQVAVFMRAWFNIDIQVASVGFLSLNRISVRVNDLQSLEIDKVSFKFRPNKSHSIGLRFGDVRIRAERILQPEKSPPARSPTCEPRVTISDVTPKKWLITKWLLKHISVDIEALNFMLLNAFVPDSLLHLEVSQVCLAGGAKHVMQAATSQSMKQTGVKVREDLPVKAVDGNLGVCLTIGEIRGKVLKSNKERTEGNTCIVEVTASLNAQVIASSLPPNLRLDYVGVDFDKLSMELHSGALIPGVLLPKKTPAVPIADVIDLRRSQKKPTVPLRQSGPIKVALMLPILTRGRISNFDLLLFGDPPDMYGGGCSHSGPEKILYVSVSTLTLSQRKDPERMVTLSVAGFAGGADDPNSTVIDLPTGYFRTKIEDFTVMNTNKMKLMSLSRISAETKMTSNCVLSSSLDFTLCYVHYVHKELLYWTYLLNHKLTTAKCGRPRVTFAVPIIQSGGGYERPASEKMSRKNPPTSTPKMEDVVQRSHPPQKIFVPRHKRTQSAPNNFPGEDYFSPQRGGQNKRPELAVPKDITSLVSVLNTLGISTVCECTFYEATVDFTLPQFPQESSRPGSVCQFSVGLDCVTTSVDHSANSQDINFMAKLDNAWWKPKTAISDELLNTSMEGSTHADLRWSSVDGTPHHRTNIHDWGTALNLDTLRLHGQATFSPASGSNSTSPDKHKCGSFWPRQHIAASVDAKVAGLQLEFSQLAARCVASVMACVAPVRGPTAVDRQSLSRQKSLPVSSMDGSGRETKKLRKYSFTLAFAETEINHVNLFLLPTDDTGCVECLVARIDSIRTESNYEDRKFYVSGVAVTTVPNPYFSAFASYESGYGHSEGRRTKPNPTIPLSIRKQQSKASQYECISANDVHPRCFGFNYLSVEYKTIEREDTEGASPSNVAALTVTLSHDRDVTVSWSPKLHILVHDEAKEIIRILRNTGSCSGKSTHRNSMPSCSKSPASKTEEYSQSPKSRLKPMMSGDGLDPPSPRPPNTPLEISMTSNSRICFKINLKENMSVELQFNPIRFTQSPDLSSIFFNKAQVIMDRHPIFTFLNVKIELALRNERVHQDRLSFADLLTPANRAWSFHLTYWSCHFPHNYDFAATFDQFVTTFKWVKKLYRETSHPFRSPKLPPDLLIAIDKFVFEIADWDFECRLRDNHELMKDEWRESEKRRKILDKRVADLRRERGEFFPAKKLGDLYRQLEDTNINIYLTRSRKMYAHPVTSSLFTWTVEKFEVSVLADESMHGMKNAVSTLQNIDKASPLPGVKTGDAVNDSEGYEFVTLWCRNIRLHAARHLCRIRNYPQYLMDINDWSIWGKFCGAEQKGSATAQRTEQVPLPYPWGPASVNRNMPTLKFYHDLSSDVQSFSMAWGPCWDPAWSQVNLAMNLLNHPSIDPSPQLPWWDKSRVLFHGRLMMTMDRSSLLQLASLDPYNTTEHMHWDWKSLLMDWTNGNFLFKGDLDIHIRNASKYDDIRFLHLPDLCMEWAIKWLCKDGADPNDHHSVEPFAPDKTPGDPKSHDSYQNFRSENLNLSVSLDVRAQKSNDEGAQSKDAEILFYSTTLRWLTNYAAAINAVTRPVCKGSIFKNHTAPKLKLSRHYKNNSLSFTFPSLKMRYWSSYTQQLGIEWRCGRGSIDMKFKLSLLPYDGPLLRRSRGDWSVVQTTCELSQTKVYLIKQNRTQAAAPDAQNQETDELSQTSSSSAASSSHEQTASSNRGTLEANFLLSLSFMSYRLENNPHDLKTSKLSTGSSSSGTIPSTPGRDRGTLNRNRNRMSQRGRRPTATPRKPPSHHRHQLVIHDLRAMWTTDNRDVGFGLYEGYNKAAILKHNLSTKVLKNILFKPSECAENAEEGRFPLTGSARSGTPSFSSDYSEQEPSSPGEKMMQSAHSLLKKLLSEADNRFVVGPEEPGSEKEQLNGVAACQMDDVINQNWRIKFVNSQAMLKGPKTQGYIILTAAETDLINREHKLAWRDEQLTSKSTWMGSLNDMQIFATVERNVHSSDKDGEDDVPWLTTGDIEPRGPSPGMLDISDLMSGGQAIGGVVGDGLSAGSFQLQRIMSRCSCRMYYVSFEAVVDSEETDYGQLLTSPTPDKTYTRLQDFAPAFEVSNDLLGKEKPINILTVVQPDLEICTNTSQYSMVLDIVENLVLYVEPGMREHWERVDSMRFQLQLTSMDDVARHRGTLTRLQDEIRLRLNNIRQLERELYTVDRALEKNSANDNLNVQSNQLQNTLVSEKETLKKDSEELGIIIRCFKELYLKQKTRYNSGSQGSDHDERYEEEVAVARRTEVSFAQVKWHLTDADGQLTIAKFELRNFLYEKVNKSDDSVEHLFELGWLCLQNLLPNSIYLDVLKPQGSMGARSYTVVGSGSRRLALRALCKVRPPVGGISIKEHLELNVVPLTIQLTDQFFKRMMVFFFPGKAIEDEDQEDHTASKDNLNATLLGLGGTSAGSQGTLKPKPPSPPKRKGSSNSSVHPPPSTAAKSSDPAGTMKRNKSGRRDRGGKSDVADDVDKMKQRAANNNTFLYIKIPQFPLCVSYKGEKEKNIEDVRDFNLTIPMLVYHNMTWTWHDLAMAIKRDCKRTLLSQVIKEKFHIGSRASQKDAPTASSGSSRTSGSLPSAGREETSEHGIKDEEKAKMLLGTNLKRQESHRRSFFKRKNK